MESFRCGFYGIATLSLSFSIFLLENAWIHLPNYFFLFSLTPAPPPQTNNILSYKRPFKLMYENRIRDYLEREQGCHLTECHGSAAAVSGTLQFSLLATLELFWTYCILRMGRICFFAGWITDSPATRYPDIRPGIKIWVLFPSHTMHGI